MTKATDAKTRATISPVVQPEDPSKGLTEVSAVTLAMSAWVCLRNACKSCNVWMGLLLEPCVGEVLPRLQLHMAFSFFLSSLKR